MQTKNFLYFRKMQKNDINQGKSAAITAYITIVGSIIAIFMNGENKSEFASFHTRQALGIHLTSFIIAPLITGFDSLLISIPFWVFFLTLWVYGFSGALQGKLNLVPLLGKYFQKWFKQLA